MHMHTQACTRCLNVSSRQSRRHRAQKRIQFSRLTCAQMILLDGQTYLNKKALKEEKKKSWVSTELALVSPPGQFRRTSETGKNPKENSCDG